MDVSTDDSGQKFARLGAMASALFRAGTSQQEIRAAVEAVNQLETPFIFATDLARLVEASAHGAFATESARKLVSVDLSGFASFVPSSARWGMEHFIPRGHVTLLSGHGGSGKSILALTWLAHLACGRAWGPSKVASPTRVLYVSLEDGEPLLRERLARIARTFDLDARLLEENLQVLEGAEGMMSLAREERLGGVTSLVPDDCIRDVESFGAGCAVIVVDNASDGLDANENERRMVRRFCQILARIARRTGAGVLLLAHVDKAAARHGVGERYSGSTAWHNSARSRLELDAKPEGVELKHVKCNVAPLASPVMLEWSADGMLFPINGDEARRRSARVLEADAVHVVEAIRSLHAAGTNVSTAHSGATTTFNLLKAHLPEHLRLVASRDRFRAALSTLERDGRIKREQFSAPNRHLRERWIPAFR